MTQFSVRCVQVSEQDYGFEQPAHHNSDHRFPQRGVVHSPAHCAQCGQQVAPQTAAGDSPRG